jgi:transposase-like protein
MDLLKNGLSISGVARRLGCSHSSVILWRDAVRRMRIPAHRDR